MDSFSSEEAMRGHALALPCFLLGACSSASLTKQEVIGQYCGLIAGQDGQKSQHVLLLTNDGRYRYSMLSNEGGRGIDVVGTYKIYGPPPVERVDLQGMCFASGCGDYPAQVLLAGSVIQIVVEDAQGAPAILTACSKDIARKNGAQFQKAR